MSPAVLHATCRKPLTVFWLATVISHAHSASKSLVNRLPWFRPRHGRDHDPAPGAVHARHHGDRFDPPAAEILMPPTTHAATLVVTMTTFAAAGASEHALARAHSDLEHGLGAQGRVDDPHGLDHRAFDVEELVEYAVHQALCGCLFILVENILPGKRSSLTPSTTQRRTLTHENNTSAKNHHLFRIGHWS